MTTYFCRTDVGNRISQFSEKQSKASICIKVLAPKVCANNNHIKLKECALNVINSLIAERHQIANKKGEKGNQKEVAGSDGPVKNLIERYMNHMCMIKIVPTSIDDLLEYLDELCDFLTINNIIPVPCLSKEIIFIPSKILMPKSHITGSQNIQPDVFGIRNNPDLKPLTSSDLQHNDENVASGLLQAPSNLSLPTLNNELLAQSEREDRSVTFHLPEHAASHPARSVQASVPHPGSEQPSKQKQTEITKKSQNP